MESIYPEGLLRHLLQHRTRNIQKILRTECLLQNCRKIRKLSREDKSMQRNRQTEQWVSKRRLVHLGKLRSSGHEGGVTGRLENAECQIKRADRRMRRSRKAFVVRERRRTSRGKRCPNISYRISSGISGRSRSLPRRDLRLVLGLSGAYMSVFWRFVRGWLSFSDSDSASTVPREGDLEIVAFLLDKRLDLQFFWELPVTDVLILGRVPSGVDDYCKLMVKTKEWNTVWRSHKRNAMWVMWQHRRVQNASRNKLQNSFLSKIIHSLSSTNVWYRSNYSHHHIKRRLNINICVVSIGL